MRGNKLWIWQKLEFIIVGLAICSEKLEKIFKNHFLTILFPIDRFGEMGPSSRTFFSNNGFTCLQVLDYIYIFYQQNMTGDECYRQLFFFLEYSSLYLFFQQRNFDWECGFFVILLLGWMDY